jgi:hypothetical protein
MIRVSAEHKGLAFYLVTGPLPDFIRADERRLRQILINLLSNAVKFTNEGQVILRVGIGKQKLEAADPLLPIRFEVEDTGIGIVPENLERIFDPFQQSKDYVRKAQGTGLGLTICRSLVELMGGSLQVESSIGQGSLFWFQLLLPEIQAGSPERGSELQVQAPAAVWVKREELHLFGDSPGAFIPPPLSELATLIELARLGDIANLRRQAESLKAKSGQLAPFVAELERLVRTFQIDIIQSWLRSYYQAED